MRTLDDMVCFDLYAASRSMTALYRPLLEPLGLTYPQYLVVLTLPADGSTSMRSLGAALDLDHGTLTPLLRRMEGSGLLTRRRSPVDERVVEVTLTPRGLDLRSEFERVQREVTEALGLSSAELARLQQVLKTMTSRMRRGHGELAG